MPSTRKPSEPFNLEPVGDRMPPPLAALVVPPIETLLCLTKINRHYARVIARGKSADFCGEMLAEMGVRLEVDGTELARLPAHGPVVVVANHPYGGIEGLAMIHALRRVRPDTKVMANYMLGALPELQDLCIFVDPFETTESKQSNFKGLRETIAWLRSGGVLGVFPSGTVASLNLQTREVVDPPWHVNIAVLARRTGAAVVPMYFAGNNGPLFQLAGLIHPRLRTVLLPRELVRRRRHPLRVQLGNPIPAATIQAIATDEECIEFMRLRCQALAGREAHSTRSGKPRLRGRKLAPRAPKPPVFPPVANAVPPELLHADLAALPAEALLARQGDFSVYQARAAQLPHVLTELGRLREISFREVGEGTGKPYDLDRFDGWYRHLLLFNHVRCELIGSYRLGLTDEIVPAHGPKGLYLFSLFQISDEFLPRIGPSIELGRSFVRVEEQGGVGPMMMLWTGIGQFFARFPHYRHMIGPVSISRLYSPVSRALMVGYLAQPQRLSPLAALVKPKRPFVPRKFAGADVLSHVRLLRDVDDLQRLITDVEPDGKGVPPLLRQYLKLGAKALAFSVDPAFGYCVDAMCVFDALETDRRTMKRFLGEQHIDRFLAAHGRLPATPSEGVR
ncbi:MAG: lysophospholipid acyltransferase family protein [Fimbriimonadaceae bacterium]|nr:lysophospholipid acyltransferase family protein [Fimbriimonadaceae bacterium]